MGFESSNIAPNPNKKKYWADLYEDPTGQTIKIFDGKEWIEMAGGSGGIYQENIDALNNIAYFLPRIQTYVGSHSNDNGITNRQAIWFTQDSSSVNLKYQWTMSTGYRGTGTEILPIATTSMPGVMSSTDKEKIDRIPIFIVGRSNASTGNEPVGISWGGANRLHITCDTFNILSGTNQTFYIDIPISTTTQAGIMSGIDRERLDKIYAALVANGTITA